jgi:hypothetical protein
MQRINEIGTSKQFVTGRLETLNGGIFTGILGAILERKIQIRKCKPDFLIPAGAKLMYK